MDYEIRFLLRPLCNNFKDYKVFVIRNKDNLLAMITWLLINHRSVVNYKVIPLI